MCSKVVASYADAGAARPVPERRDGTVDNRAGPGGAADRRHPLRPHRRRSADRRAPGYQLLIVLLVAAALVATLALDGAIVPR